MVMNEGPGAAGTDDAPAGWEWGCEDCGFSALTGQGAFAHSDEHKHSLALRPRREPARVVDDDVLAVVQRALDVCYFRRRDDGPGAISNYRGLADAVAALPEAKL
jgi:hypothetical protein